MLSSSSWCCDPGCGLTLYQEYRWDMKFGSRD